MNNLWRYVPRSVTHVETKYYKNHDRQNSMDATDNIEKERSNKRNSNKKKLIDNSSNKPEPVNIPEEVLRGSTIIIEDIYKLFMGYSSAKYGLNKNLSISLFWLNGDNLRFKSYLTQKKHQKVKNCTNYSINSESNF